MTFSREHRYIVIKCDDAANYLSSDQQTQLDGLLNDINTGLVLHDHPTRNYVVVEEGWPEFPIVWKMVEERVRFPDKKWGIFTPGPNEAYAAPSRLAALDDAFWHNRHMLEYVSLMAGSKPIHEQESLPLFEDAQVIAWDEAEDGPHADSLMDHPQPGTYRDYSVEPRSVYEPWEIDTMIRGARIFGADGINQPPLDHWLHQHWLAGAEYRQQFDAATEAAQ